MHMCNMSVTHIVYHILCILHVLCIRYNLTYVYINIRQIKVTLLWAKQGLGLEIISWVEDGGRGGCPTPLSCPPSLSSTKVDCQ